MDKLVEQLTEGLGEDVIVKEKAEPIEIQLEEDSVEETTEAETVTEEPTAEESTAEESAAQESAAQESAAEEAAAEEPVAEETPVKKKKKIGMIIGIAVAALVLVLGAVYFAIAMKYSDKFFKGTVVNGVDCSEMTIKEVEAILQSQVEEYVLTIQKIDGTTEQIDGTDIEITYIGHNQIKDAFKKQNKFLWPKSLFEGRNIEADVQFNYNTEKLDEKIAGLELIKTENQVAPISATVIYENGKFVIRDEVYGTQVDAAKVSEAIHAVVGAMKTMVDLNEAGCYVQPVYTKESKEVLAAQEEMNKYISAKITYSVDGTEIVVDGEDIAPWVFVDANMAPQIAQDKVRNFTNTLGATYDTPNRSGVMVSPSGKEVTIKDASLGRRVGSAEECTQLISDIKAGRTVTRQPVFSRTEMAEGVYVWSNTYIEVDITTQHMWYIKNGQIALETDIVTGQKGKNDTPTGTFTVLEKMRNKTLRGRIINGKPEYLTPVSYWMRITWSGVGFHDAGWQPTFGGDRYTVGGSHGCINMPPAKAKELYGMLSLGTPVVIHY